MQLKGKSSSQKGAIFIFVIGLISVFLVTSILFITLLTTDTKIASKNRNSNISFYIAEAGVEKAIVALNENTALRDPQTGTLNGGGFYTTFSDEPDGTILIKSIGTYQGAQRTVKLKVIIGSWPMFHYNPARTGYTPQAIYTPFNIDWTYNAGAPILSSAVEENNKVYFGCNDDYVYVLDARTGAFLGRFRTGGDVVSTPAVVDNIIYVGSNDTYLYAINADTGELIWSKSDPIVPSAIKSSPAVAEGVVYIGSDSGRIYALDALTGDLKPGWPYTAGGAIVGAPAVDVGNGVVYFGALDGRVYALDAVTGALKPGWPYTTSGPIYSSPAVENGMIYIGSDDTYVYALRTDGTMATKYKTSGRVRSSPAVRNGTVYVGSDDTDVYALRYISFWWGSSFIRLWRFNTPQDVRSSPSVCGNLVFVGSDDQKIYAVDITRGRKRAEYRTGGDVRSSPAIFGDNVYVTGTDGKIYAFSGRVAVPGPVKIVNYSWYDTY